MFSRLVVFIVLNFAFISANAIDFDLDMKKLNGETGSLEEYVGKGKWTLVMLWETTCSICKQQEPEYSAFHQRHKDNNAEVIGIAIDGTENLQLITDYLKNNPLPYPIMVANKPELRERYFAATDEYFRGTPTYLLFAPDGKLIANQPGMLPAASVEFYIEEKSAQN